jgi:hypothetical protein
VSDGDSGSDQEQKLEFGTNFTVNLSQTELTAEQRDAISNDIIAAISNDIIAAIIARIGGIPPENIFLGSAAWAGLRASKDYSSSMEGFSH